MPLAGDVYGLTVEDVQTVAMSDQIRGNVWLTYTLQRPILLLRHDPNFTRIERSTGIAATTDTVICCLLFCFGDVT
jgi:hypothetical protein